MPVDGTPPTLPGVSDRLAELRRQRALVQQHLAWLDEEIAAAEGAATRPAAPMAPSRARETVPADADALLARFADEERLSPRKLKLGCWLAFLIALAAFAGAIALWYFLQTGP